jgi:hypothetical protein
MAEKKKHCPGCDTKRPVSMFWKNKTAKDGLQTYCKPCYSVWYNKGGNAAAKKVGLTLAKAAARTGVKVS